MKDEVLGVKVLPSNSSDHQPGTIEVSEPHRLLGFGDRPTRLRYVSVIAYGADRQPAVIHQVPELPTRLGVAATNLITEVFIRTSSVRV